MTPPPFNGDGRVTFRYVAGILVTILTLIGGALVSGIKNDITELRSTVTQKSEETAALRAEMNSVNNQLVRIEAKLDRLLEAR